MGESSTRCLVQLLPSEFLFDGVPLTFLLHPRHNTWKTSPHCQRTPPGHWSPLMSRSTWRMPCSVASPTSSLSTTGLSRSEDETNVRLANLCTKVKKDFLFHSTSKQLKQSCQSLRRPPGWRCCPSFQHYYSNVSRRLVAPPLICTMSPTTSSEASISFWVPSLLIILAIFC